MTLEQDTILILLQKVPHRDSQRIDLVNGESYRWVRSDISVQSLVAVARELTTSHRDIQLSDFSVAGLDNGELSPLELDELNVSRQPTKQCHGCYKHLEHRYYPFVGDTTRRWNTCTVCLNASRIPFSSLPNEMSRHGDI